MTTFNLSRSMSSYESGIGRGMGFRDSSQDILGFASMIPSRARQRLLDLAATQIASGGANHQYQPLTKRGNAEIGSGFNDDPLWLIFAVSAYLKETGDLGLLGELVPTTTSKVARRRSTNTSRVAYATRSRVWDLTVFPSLAVRTGTIVSISIASRRTLVSPFKRLRTRRVACGVDFHCRSVRGRVTRVGRDGTSARQDRRRGVA